MRTLVFDDTKKTGYSSYLLSLLLEFLKQKKNISVANSTIKNKSDANKNFENEIIIQDSSAKPFPFFYTLYLRYFIKKKRIHWLVQVIEKNTILSHFPQLIIPTNTAKLVLKKPLSLSTKIAVSSEKEKQDLINIYPFAERNICIIYASASNSFQPISWSEKQSVKMQYTQGKEYFFVNGANKPEIAFTSLLKAFSRFKKWQHSSMKLVVIGKLGFSQTKESEEKLATYKYRDDLLIGIDWKDNDHVALLAGAYAFIHTPIHGNDVIPLLQAMQCETPCISFPTDTLKEYSNEATIWIENDNYEQLSEKLILLYKDETLRSSLIEAGKKKAQQYSKEKALQNLIAAMPADFH